MMHYPTPEQVEAADAIQLLRWHRYLPSPGVTPLSRNTTTDEFNALVKEQLAILHRIDDRLQALGGITPEISKAVGWGEI